MICLDPPFGPHLSETSFDCFLVLLFSPFLSFGFLDLEKLFASLGLIISPPYSCIGRINLPTCCFSPWSAYSCLLKWLLFPSGPSCDWFSSYSTSSPSSSPKSSGTYSTSLSTYIFLPHSHWYHIHGHLCPLLQKYCHMWLSFPLPRSWQNILLPMTLGCYHPHQNSLVHSFCCCHHYGGAVEHLSGCQNLFSPCSSKTMFPGIPSKMRPFSISGCLSSLPSSSTLAITSFVIGKYVHIKPCSLRPVLRNMK